jgi:ABC-type nickel/cobalt efflux system permease component RcnA
VHALSPGHGKTVVGAYLIGSRGTARHAMFLGLTVTITHTAGVFALGLVTLFASQYVLPEQLYPILSLISGAIVLIVGLSLFVRRLRAARATKTSAPSDPALDHAHSHEGHSHSHHTHDHAHAHADHEHSHHVHADDHHHHEHADHSHQHGDHTHTHAEPHHDHAHAQPHHHDHDHADHHHDDDGALVHSHGGKAHSHLPPGSDGGAVTWRSLLALGISGGLLPCPSALVVMLSAISLHRVGYGLLLVIAFSIGLASTLTGIGLLFVYAKRLLKRQVFSGRLVRLLPVASALVIACAGAAICYEAIATSGSNITALVTQLFR